jgi:hypothetical protein
MQKPREKILIKQNRNHWAIDHLVRDSNSKDQNEPQTQRSKYCSVLHSGTIHRLKCVNKVLRIKLNKDS